MQKEGRELAKTTLFYLRESRVVRESPKTWSFNVQSRTPSGLLDRCLLREIIVNMRLYLQMSLESC